MIIKMVYTTIIEVDIRIETPNLIIYIKKHGTSRRKKQFQADVFLFSIILYIYSPNNQINYLYDRDLPRDLTE